MASTADPPASRPGRIAHLHELPSSDAHFGESPFDAIVIGSGPNGIAATKALVDQGMRLLVLDAGGLARASDLDGFDELGAGSPEAWRSATLERVRQSFAATVRSVPLRPAYGSLYPYAVDDEAIEIDQHDTELVASLARGGLSNTWGAAMLPWRNADFDGWPIGLGDLEAHYKAVLDFVPLTAAHDDLEAVFPLHSDRLGTLAPAPQAERALATWRAHRSTLADAGFRFGTSRLALHGEGSGDAGCRRCGLCLYGCPYGSIYNAAATLADLLATGRISYLDRVFATEVSELDNGTVSVALVGRDGRADQRVEARRVFLAAGSVATAQLVARSLHVELPLRLLDSQYFLLPMLALRHTPVSMNDRVNTLAQAFLELDDEGVAAHTVHLQLYAYSDSILKALIGRLHLSEGQAERSLQQLLGRLVVLQGFFHSADSASISLEVDGATVHATASGAAEARHRVRRLVARIARHPGALGMVPLAPLLQIGAPGKSFHTGGTFPMRARPVGLETDRLGRIAPWRNVHLVDTSVLPSIAATTITFTAMANAHRIASEAARS